MEVGVILKDPNGEIIFDASVVEHETPNPEIVEALAIFPGFQLCLNQDIQNLVVECHCMLVVEELNNMETNLSQLGAMWRRKLRG